MADSIVKQQVFVHIKAGNTGIFKIICRKSYVTQIYIFLQVIDIYKGFIQRLFTPAYEIGYGTFVSVKQKFNQRYKILCIHKPKIILSKTALNGLGYIWVFYVIAK